MSVAGDRPHTRVLELVKTCVYQGRTGRCPQLAERIVVWTRITRSVNRASRPGVANSSESIESARESGNDRCQFVRVDRLSQGHLKPSHSRTVRARRLKRMSKDC